MLNIAACFCQYQLERSQQEHSEAFFLGFSCSELPPLDPSFSLPLYLSAACSPMVVALILIGQQALNTVQFSVECDTLYIM